LLKKVKVSVWCFYSGYYLGLLMLLLDLMFYL